MALFSINSSQFLRRTAPNKRLWWTFYLLTPAWFRSRPYHRLWRGLAALGVIAIALVAGLVVLSQTPETVDRHYAAAIDRALEHHDFDTARVACLRRLLYGNDHADTLFKLSEALKGLGRDEDAEALLIDLAANYGYEPAHLALAQNLLNQKQVTASTLRLAELHLAGAVQANPNSPGAAAVMKLLAAQMKNWELGKPSYLALDRNSMDAHELAGWLYFSVQDWQAAKPHLLAEVASKPMVMFMLARTEKGLGNDDGMRTWTARAAEFYRDKVGHARTDNPSDRVTWALAEVMQENYDQALQILREGQKKSGMAAYGNSVAWLYGVWAEEMGADAPGNLTSRHTLVSLLSQLETLSRLNGSAARTAREALAKVEEAEAVSPQVFTTLGMEACAKGEYVIARDFLSRAYDLAPNEPVVANNMALILVLSAPPDPYTALKISQPLVDRFPNQPNFRDTHGQILVALGRWQDAVKDLEYALPKLNNTRATHLALAKAYRKLNRLDEAKKQEQLARQPPPASLTHPADDSNLALASSAAIAGE